VGPSKEGGERSSGGGASKHQLYRVNAAKHVDYIISLVEVNQAI